MQRATPAGAYLIGCGVAIGGMVRRADGMVRLGPHIGWVDAPLGAALAEVLSPEIPIAVANVAALAALAEHTRGAAVDSAHVTYPHGGVGLRGGLIPRGRPAA